MRYTVENEYLKISADTHGAELMSVINKQTGAEMLWQGDPAVWDRRAPVLFPYVGKLRGGEYRLDGKTYKGVQHGFIRDLEHTCIKAENGVLHFVRKADEQTRQLLPRRFVFETIFTLEGRTLRHTIRVTNEDEKELRFGLGFHPGFALPFDENHKTEDYELRFEIPQTPMISETDQVSADPGLSLPTSYPLMENSPVIPLHDRLFDNDSLTMTKLTAKTLAVVEKDTGRKITIGIEGYPNVLIWSMPGTPTMRFICMEPWCVLQDAVDASGDWNDKPCAAQLAPGESWSTDLNMTFER